MCAIFGVLDYKGKLEASQRLQLVKRLGTAAEVRGTDAAGIAYFQREKLCIQKAPKPAHKMRYHIPHQVRCIMGHTRMTTQGSAKRNQNNHPFSGRASGKWFALAHNGVLTNDWQLRQENMLPQTNIETDSYVAVQLIEKQDELSFHSLRRMAEVLEGPFTFSILDQDNTLYFVKGSNPLTIYHYRELGLYLYASTEEILEAVSPMLGEDEIYPEIIEPWPGDILSINCRGELEYAGFTIPDLFPGWGFQQAVSPTKQSTIQSTAQNEHIQMLKSIARVYGYGAGTIDTLLADGYTAEDIEDLIYCSTHQYGTWGER